MPYDSPLPCPWRCHEIGGPWIAEDPECPFHGVNADLESMTQEEGDRLCREKEAEEGDEWRSS